MNYPSYDADYARDRYNELLREAEQHRRIHALQSQQPSLLNQLKSQLGSLAELVRPQRNRASRA